MTLNEILIWRHHLRVRKKLEKKTQHNTTMDILTFHFKGDVYEVHFTSPDDICWVVRNPDDEDEIIDFSDLTPCIRNKIKHAVLCNTL